jgi:hypothetical protein
VTGPTLRIVASRQRASLLSALALVSIGVTRVASAGDAFEAAMHWCAGETDSARRLQCYDREVARDTQASTPGGAPPPSNTPSPNSTPTPPVTLAPTVTTPPAALTQSKTGNSAADAATQHISARIVRVEYAPDDLVVHLDNGQVWEQTEPATSELGLRTGDTVTIDRQLGAYWLSKRNGGSIRVALRQ